MNPNRSISVLLTICASLLLSGCFVISKHAPLGSGSHNDETILGDWRGTDDDGKDEDVFIHIQDPRSGDALRVVFVENREYQIYELRTAKLGNRNVFAAKTIGPREKGNDKEVPDGFFLGYYEVTGDKLIFYMLDAEKVNALIKQNKLKGKPGKEKYDFTTLKGSPADIAKFMGSPDGWNSRVSDPTTLKRLSKAK